MWVTVKDQFEPTPGQFGAKSIMSMLEMGLGQRWLLISNDAVWAWAGWGVYQPRAVSITPITAISVTIERAKRRRLYECIGADSSRMRQIRISGVGW